MGFIYLVDQRKLAWDGMGSLYTWWNRPQRQRLCLIGAVGGGADSCPPGSSFSSYQMPKVSGVQRHQLTFWRGSRTSDSAAAHIVPAAALPAKVLLPRHETVIYNLRRNSRTKLTKQHLIKSNKTVFIVSSNCSRPSSPPRAARQPGQRRT